MPLPNRCRDLAAAPWRAADAGAPTPTRLAASTANRIRAQGWARAQERARVRQRGHGRGHGHGRVRGHGHGYGRAAGRHRQGARRLLRRLHRIDRAAFEAVATAHLPGLEYVLPRLSRMADHAVLWLATAGVLAATRRPRLRRAALRGSLAVGMASPLVNTVGKHAFRRRRPLVDLVPPVRIRWQLPTSPAFPSGHSASAAAFATGVALEAPRRVALPVAALAGTVAFSRVYNGAHYPGDVLAGVGIGIAAGYTTRVLWPSRPVVAHVARTSSAPLAASDMEDGLGLIAVINQGAGGGGQIASVLGRELPAAEIIVVEPGDDVAGILDAAAARARVLAVAGGDGTVNAGAQVALRHGVPLLTVPGGTLDHFSRALGIDTPADAVAAFRGGCLAKVDVGCVEQPDGSEQVFLNTAGFGVYTRLVDLRERLEGRIGKWPALAISALHVLRRAEPVEVVIDGRRRRVWLIFVGNCAYGSMGTAPTWREHLDDGLLDIRMISAARRFGRPRAVLAVLASGLRFAPEYTSRRAPTLRLEAVSGELRLARDGEVCSATPSVVFTKRPGSLAVFTPRRPAG